MFTLISTPQLSTITDIFKDYPYPWFVCGGWAIDLFLDQVTREHADIEIGVFRSDQKSMHTFLEAWDRSFRDTDGHHKPWNNYQDLTWPVHEIHATHPEKSRQRIEILLNEKIGENWAYRRDTSIQYSLAKTIQFHSSGIPYLATEIVLLYKSKHLRDKDQADFNTAFPTLNKSARKWLIDAIRKMVPNHPWVSLDNTVYP